jgi:hypothetical protein
MTIGLSYTFMLYAPVRPASSPPSNGPLANWPVPCREEWPERPTHVFAFTGWGLSVTRYHALVLVRNNAHLARPHGIGVDVFRAGWPMQCMECMVIEDTASSVPFECACGLGVSSPNSLRGAVCGVRCYPTRFIAGPFMLNVGILAMAAITLFMTSAGIRRVARVRRNRCRECGYPRRGITADAVCPECGAAA